MSLYHLPVVVNSLHFIHHLSPPKPKTVGLPVGEHGPSTAVVPEELGMLSLYVDCLDREQYHLLAPTVILIGHGIMSYWLPPTPGVGGEHVSGPASLNLDELLVTESLTGHLLF